MSTQDATDNHIDATTADETPVEAQKARTSKRRTKSGCLTCRRRRIKCDERPVHCYNCEKSRRHCEGYQRLIFREPPVQYRTDQFSQPRQEPTYSNASQYHPVFQPRLAQAVTWNQAQDYNQVETQQYVPGPLSYQDIVLGNNLSQHNPYASLPIQLLPSQPKRLIHDRETESRANQTALLSANYLHSMSLGQESRRGKTALF